MYTLHIYVCVCIIFEADRGAMRLLDLYTGLLCSHVADILPLACSLAGYSPQHFLSVSNIIKADVTGRFDISSQPATCLDLPVVIVNILMSIALFADKTSRNSSNNYRRALICLQCILNISFS